MKKIYLFFIVGLGIIGPGLAQKSLNLKDAITLTITNNPRIKQLEASKNASSASVEKARSYFYPHLAVNAGYTRIDPTGYVEFPSPSGPVQTSFIPNDNYNLNLGLQYTIYDFGRTHAGVEMAASGAQIAGNYLVLSKQELAFATIRVFYQIHFLQEAIQVQGDQIDALQKVLEQTKKLQNNGKATDYEILSTQVKLSGALNKADDLKTALQNALIQLKKLTGKNDITAQTLKNDWLNVNKPDSITTTLDFEQIPQYEIAKLKSDQAKFNTDMAKADFNPYLQARIEGGYKNAIQPEIDQLKLNYTASLQLTIPIFSGFKNKFNLQQAEAEKVAADFDLKSTSDDIKAEMDQALENLNNAYNKISRSELQVEQAEKSARLARVKYDNGIITNLDLLDAEIALSEAKINKLNTVFNYTINAFHLKKTMGIHLY